MYLYNKQNKNLIKKTTVVMFIVLFAIVLGEFLYILNSFKVNSFSIAPNVQKLTPPPSLNPAFNTDSLSMLSYWQKGVVTSAKVTTELKGTIVKIDANGKVTEHGWSTFNYALKIRIQGENGDGNDIFISPAELQKTVFNKMTADDGKISMDYKDLKLGDKIQIFMTFDLTKDFVSNFDKAEIIKL